MAIIKDLSGLKYKRLTFIRYDHKKGNDRMWLCRCDCGNEIYIPTNKFGITESCGCLGIEKSREINAKKSIDISGKKFGRLIAVKIDHYEEHCNRKREYWLCKCDCGKNHVVIKRALISGKSKSCGCLHKDILREMKNDRNPFYKHGETISRLWKIWRGILDRCNNNKLKNYKWYGGRGIKICNEWEEYIHFRDWALVNGYSDTLTIDRINNDGNYEASNCRWATMKEQQNHRRNNHIITYNGDSLTVSQWEEKLNVCKGFINDRIKRGYSEIDAVSLPVQRKKVCTINDK